MSSWIFSIQRETNSTQIFHALTNVNISGFLISDRDILAIWCFSKYKNLQTFFQSPIIFPFFFFHRIVTKTCTNWGALHLKNKLATAGKN